LYHFRNLLLGCGFTLPRLRYFSYPLSCDLIAPGRKLASVSVPLEHLPQQEQRERTRSQYGESYCPLGHPSPLMPIEGRTEQIRQPFFGLYIVEQPHVLPPRALWRRRDRVVEREQNGPPLLLCSNPRKIEVYTRQHHAHDEHPAQQRSHKRQPLLFRVSLSAQGSRERSSPLFLVPAYRQTGHATVTLHRHSLHHPYRPSCPLLGCEERATRCRVIYFKSLATPLLSILGVPCQN